MSSRASFNPAYVSKKSRLTDDYDFPVSISDAYTKDGIVIPKIKVVMREDTKKPLAAVSNKYMLVTHKEVVEAAEGLISKIGTPDKKFALVQGGAGLIGTFTYLEHKRQVSVGDAVGLRVFFENSYNTKSSVKISIGALVLSCLNGMVSTRAAFSFTVRHLGAKKHLLKDGMPLPHPEEILGAYEAQTRLWKSYTERQLDYDQRHGLGEALVRARAMPSTFLKAYRPAYTVWDGMQQATYFVTHRSPRLTPAGRMERLQRVSAFFEQNFM